MFKSLRWQLTLWFVLLAGFLYMASTVVGMWWFKVELTRVIDEELHALADEMGPMIVFKHGQPSLEEWSNTKGKIPFKFSQSIQLYNSKSEMIESFGLHGVTELAPDQHEFKSDYYHIRNLATPIYDGSKIAGYLQIQLSLKNIDHAIAQFGSTIYSLAPFVLIGLGIAGYFFAGVAAAPVEKSFMVLQRFLSDAGHELSTPISIIQANAEAMEMEVPATESTSSRLSVIYRSNERMNNLVSDLMLLSKMESPKLSAKQHSIRFEKLVLTVVEEFQELFKSKSVTLTVKDLPAALLQGDAEALKRMVTNLLQNALRYTDRNGKVEVDLENYGRHMVLSISDTGIGIPQDSLPHIFERFYRVDTSRSRDQGGSGLGLSIVKAIVDAHRGRIEVHSEQGKGTEFSITLPTSFI